MTASIHFAEALLAMSASFDIQSFQQACCHATSTDLERLAAMFLNYSNLASSDAEATMRQAAIPLVNQLIHCGMLGICFQVVRCITDRFDAPEFMRLRTDLSRHLGTALVKQSEGLVQDQSGYFLSALLRPVLAKDHGLVADGQLPSGIAIVMQGPILSEMNFTVETLHLYSRIFPGVDLVLSTWEGEPVDAIRNKLPHVHVLTNSKPNPGPSNINMQIVSAREGVRFACEQLRSAHIMKTRTDMRLYNPNALLDMLALLEQFPCKYSTTQKKRLLIISDVVKYMQYAVPDKTMFGTSSDMWTYWSPPLDDRPAGMVLSQPTMRSWTEQKAAEVYLTRNYLERLGRQQTGTLEDHFNVLRDLFVVYDRSAADVYWPKYARQIEYRFKQYGYNQMLEEFGFNDWLRLQSVHYRSVAPDAILDAPQMSSISELLDTERAYQAN